MEKCSVKRGKNILTSLIGTILGRVEIPANITKNAVVTGVSYRYVNQKNPRAHYFMIVSFFFSPAMFLCTLSWVIETSFALSKITRESLFYFVPLSHPFSTNLPGLIFKNAYEYGGALVYGLLLRALERW